MGDNAEYTRYSCSNVREQGNGEPLYLRREADLPRETQIEAQSEERGT